MLLRSSSTPISHSFLFSACSDSPTRDSTTATHHHHKPQHHPDNSTAKLSVLIPHPHHHHPHHLLPPLRSTPSSNSSPISNSSSGYSPYSPQPIQRAQSDSNLHGLSLIAFNFDEFFSPKTAVVAARSLPPKQKWTMLRTEPSFAIYHNPEDNNEDLVVGIDIDRLGSGDFSFGKTTTGMGLIEEVDDEEGGKDENLLGGIKNLDIGGNGIGGGGGADDGLKSTNFDEGGGDFEGYYKRMLAQDPSNALFLRNYAQFLQSKGDLHGAEEYYFLATLADPKDGEVLMQYGKLVWELHHDQDRASSYFERAARVAPEDSNVLAAYAGFLWEIDDDEDDDEGFAASDPIQNPAFEEDEMPLSPLHLAAGFGVDVSGMVRSSTGTAEGPSFGGNVEDYYKRKLKEDPSNPLFLRNYAQFLSQSKGDLQGAELYYSRAMLADPEDGEVISRYANLVWELHQNQRKASYYFDRAVQAAPMDSHVLAAHAKFLWEADDEEPGVTLHKYQLPYFME